MLRPFLLLLLTSIIVTTLGTSTATARDRQALNDQPQFINGRLMLPAWETDWEKRMLLRKDTAAQLHNWRTAHPELYGVTLPPVQPVRMYAEYDPVDAIHYVWEPGMFDDFFFAFTHEIITQTTVTVYILHHGAADRAALETYITNHGDDPSAVTFIDMATLGDYYVWQTEWPYNRSLESFWTVDFGPYWVQDGGGTLSIVDPRYYPWRVNDDAVPAKLGSALGVNVFRPNLDYEGGNLFSDGQGTCFATGAHVAYNAPLIQTEIEDQLFDYFGCEKMIWLFPMYGEGTGHIDMFFNNASATTLILGEYDAAIDPDNATLLDYNLSILESETNAAGDPFDVLRVPMPDNSDGVFRSYTNGIEVNDLVLVPVYSNHTTYEAAALAVFQQAFPGRTVVGIDAEDIIDWGGAIHCVTRTRPAGTLAQMETPPADACAGAYDCTTGCGDFDFTGDCIYNAPVWCEDGEIAVESCPPGQRCGWDLQSEFFYCITAGCGNLPPEGECVVTAEGRDVAVTCEGGFSFGDLCDPGTQCTMDPSTGAGCQPCAINECDDYKSKGCDGDGNAWVCGLDDATDNCLDVITTVCAPNEVCEDGECVCVDDCAAGETGCTADGDAYTCGEADDGDTCLERLITVCTIDETCEDGQCVPCTDECAMGDKGCDADGNAWVCGEAYDGDSCHEPVTVPCEQGCSCKDGDCVEDENKGCGCATDRPESLGGLLLLLLGLALSGGLRRRRPASR